MFQLVYCIVLVGTLPRYVPTSILHHQHITYNQLQPVYHTIHTSPATIYNHYITPSTHHLQPVYRIVNTSPTASSNQYTTPSTHHLQPVPTSISHHPHITYNQFQLVYHTITTSPTTSSNQYTTPSTHHLRAALKLTTSLQHQSSLSMHQTILTPKILINCCPF